jgi:hypothetical protein
VLPYRGRHFPSRHPSTPRRRTPDPRWSRRHSRCNDQSAFGSGDFDQTNPFTPDILVDQDGNTIGLPLAKPSAAGVGLQPDGQAIDIAFERGFQGGRLFATDSNQTTHAHNGQGGEATLPPLPPGSPTACAPSPCPPGHQAHLRMPDPRWSRRHSGADRAIAGDEQHLGGGERRIEALALQRCPATGS